jgi:hypothetical protein
LAWPTSAAWARSRQGIDDSVPRCEISVVAARARCYASSMSSPENQPAPRLKAPPGTWDVHMHVYEPGYAIAPTATSKPHDAPTSEYLKVRKNLGIAHTVVVQPSAYGKDNSCTLAAMKMMGPDSRGIAVADESVTDAELQRCTRPASAACGSFSSPAGS